jgi:hypothetical protein
VTFAQKLESSARNTLRNYAPAVASAANAAASKVPTVGFGSFADRESAVAGAISDVQSAAAEQAWHDALQENREQAQKLGDNARGKMLASKATISAGFAKALGPLALRDKFDMDAASRVGEVRKEAETTPPSRLLAMYEALIAQDDQETEREFTMAIKPVVRELAGASYTKLKAAIGPSMSLGGMPITGAMPDTPERRDALEKERKSALELLRKMDERAAALVPESLTTARAAYDELVSVYSCLFGHHAMVIDRAAYELRYGAGHPTDPLDLNVSWPVTLGKALSAGAGSKQ